MFIDILKIFYIYIHQITFFVLINSNRARYRNCLQNLQQRRHVVQASDFTRGLVQLHDLHQHRRIQRK